MEPYVSEDNKLARKLRRFGASYDLPTKMEFLCVSIIISCYHNSPKSVWKSLFKRFSESKDEKDVRKILSGIVLKKYNKLLDSMNHYIEKGVWDYSVSDYGEVFGDKNNLCVAFIDKPEANNDLNIVLED